jgi:hypothetical protein
MSACATQTFTGITQARFNCLVQKAQANGISISGNVGQDTKDGITIRWKFDPAGQTLELQCMSSPFFISCGMVNSQIHQIVDGCP